MVQHTAIGFKGTVNQIAEAKRMARLGPRFTVDNAAAWAVTPTSADRTVSISPGSAQACGVSDTTTQAELLQLPVNSSGQIRHDLIISRFKWTDPVTDPVFTYVTGVPGAGEPNTAGLVRTPGTQYDAVLAVVRVANGQGALNANDIFKVAPVGGIAGPLVIPQGAFLHLVDGQPRSQLEIADSVTRYRLNSTGWSVDYQPWTELTARPVDFIQPAESNWLDIDGLTGQVVAPAGRTLKVKLIVPKINVPLGNGGLFLRLLINGAFIDSGSWQADGGTSFGTRGELETSYPYGNDAPVGIQAQVRGEVAGGYVQGDGSTGPRVLYEIS